MSTQAEQQATQAPPWDVDRLSARLVAGGPRQEWRSPFDPDLVTSLPTSSSADVATAFERARRAQRWWAARPVRDRARVLLRFHDLVVERFDDLLDLIQLEGGKSRLSAAEETLHVALSARYYARQAPGLLRPRPARGMVPGLTRVRLERAAKGVVGVISPWNYPLTMAMSDGLGALAAGNAVVLKPDLQTPFCALAAVDLLIEAGMPTDLWPVVHGPGAEVGPELIKAADYVCFTGSTEVGIGVAEQCGKELIDCSMELGGKNPLVVLDDADLDAAVEGAARASFANTGQLCVSAERIYVDASIHDAFLTAFSQRVQGLRLGNSLDYGHDVGGLINFGQLDHVADQIEDAVSKGATVRAGGRRRPDLGPLFYEPTVLSGVTPEMSIFAEETFGPAVSVYAVRDEDEAVSRANDSAYGLNASVWTSDPARGRRVASRIACGTVNVNDGYAATFGSLDAPMGGMKRSGLGRRQGDDGLLRFTEVRSIATQSRLLPLAPQAWLPADRFVDAMKLALRVLRRTGRP